MTMATAIGDETSHVPAGKLSALMLGALGVVYGDIGTSPLYTLKTALNGPAARRRDVRSACCR